MANIMLSIRVDPNSFSHSNTTPGWWSLIKYDDHVYLRGWVAAPPTENALPGRTMDINNTEGVPENGDRPAEVTLRLDTLKYCSFYERISVAQADGYAADIFSRMDEKVTVSDVHLDQHAWERAKSVMSTKQPLILAQWKHKIVKDQDKHYKAASRKLENLGSLSIAYQSDDKPFTLKYEDLAYLLTGTPATALCAASDNVDLAHPAHSSQWLAVKHQGSLYLRGWIAGDLSQKNLTGPFLHLYNSPSPSELDGIAKPISLRLGNFQYGSTGRFYAKESYYEPNKAFNATDSVQQIVLTKVHLDNHAWEKW